MTATAAALSLSISPYFPLETSPESHESLREILSGFTSSDPLRDKAQSIQQRGNISISFLLLLFLFNPRQLSLKYINIHIHIYKIKKCVFVWFFFFVCLKSCAYTWTRASVQHPLPKEKHFLRTKSRMFSGEKQNMTRFHSGRFNFRRKVKERERKLKA